MVTRSNSPENSPDATNRAAIDRRRFLIQSAVAAGACMSIGGCWSRCSNKGGEGPVVKPESPQPTVHRIPLPAREPQVRVRIAEVRPNPARLNEQPAQITCGSRWIRVKEADRDHLGLIMKSPIEIARTETDWKIVDADGHTPLIGGLDAVELLPDGDQGTGLAFDGATYPGSLRLVARTEESALDFDIINLVSVERYLPGVLEKELFSHWHPEAFAAQAVAARSFACAEIEYWRARRHFDVTNTQRSQAYVGESDSTRAHQAVRRTRGIVLAYEQGLVPAYYSSCCGGIAARAIDAIGPNPVNDIPPLDSRVQPDACREAPVYRWSATRTIAETSRRFTAWGSASHHFSMRNFGTLRSIEVADTNPHGRPTSYNVRDAGTTEARLTANQLREAFDHSGMGLSAPQTLLKSSFLSIEVDPREGTVHIAGRGFGHGVGLCQYGAQALAQRDMPYRDILAAFYPRAAMTGAFI